MRAHLAVASLVLFLAGCTLIAVVPSELPWMVPILGGLLLSSLLLAVSQRPTTSPRR